MSGLREHVELKETGVAVVNVPQSHQQTHQRKAGGLQVNRRVAIIGTICLVAVVACAATLSVLLTGHEDTDHTEQAVALHEEGNQVAPKHHNPIAFNPVGPLAGVNNAFQQMALHMREAAAEQELKAEKNHDKVPSSFEEVEIPLEQPQESYIGDRKPIYPRHDYSQPRPVPAHPDFEEMEVEIEFPEKPDAPRRIKEKEEPQPSQLKEAHHKREKVTQKSKQEVETAVREKTEKNSVEEVEDSTSVEDVEEKTSVEVLAAKKVPSPRQERDPVICETPECAVAASQISESLDLSTSPCDDFFQFACGGWIDKHPVPDSGSIGTFGIAADVLENRLHLILETPAEPSDPAPLHMIRTFYETCKDTDTMDSLGLGPVATSLLAQGGWPMVEVDWDPTAFSLTTAINNLRDLSVYPLVSVGVDLDIQNTSTKIIYIDAGSVPLGVNLMYNPGEGVLGPYRTFMTEASRQFRDYVGSSMTDQQIDVQVQQIIDFEIAFSEVVQRAENETTNVLWRTDVTGIQTDTDAGTLGQFNWLAFLKEMFTNTGVTITTDEPVISFKSTFFSDFSNLLSVTDTKTLANAIGWWWLMELQEETTYAMRNASVQFLGDLFGVGIRPRWQRCKDLTNLDLGFALSREYVDEFMASTTKEETTQLVEDIRSSFNTLMDDNTWMLPEDLVVAREKLQAIDPFVAYPDWIMDDTELTLGYEGLIIVNGREVDNLKSIGAWYDFNSLSSLRDEPEHSFLFPPTVVNAFYNPQENTITILAGILQPPFYAHNSLAALNYGGIGMVIGHEMTHGFDNTGRLFDKDGNVVQWWSDPTISEYLVRAQCFVDQYNNYIPPELAAVGLNISVDGVQTEGENIADNGGIREAYRAYQLYVDRNGEEPRLPGLDEFSPNHLFYLGFANIWCENKDAQAVLGQLASDPHSPGRFRVLGPLSNDEEFSRVWNCPAGSPMNRGEDRCLLW